MTDLETLCGELVSFEVRMPDGWGTGVVRTSAGDTHKITGKLGSVKPGESVELAGSWTDTKYGRQFKVQRCVSTVPQTLAGVVTWMMALPDIGEKRAREMVLRWGVAGLWELIETEPRTLCSISGITPERADAIAEAYQKRAVDRDAMITLHGWGLTDKQIDRCKEQWDCEPEGVVLEVRANPYKLMDDVPGFGFKRADDVGIRSGIARDSPYRIGAALRHLMGETVSQGHCFVTQGKLRVMAQKLLELPETAILPVLDNLYYNQRLVLRGQRVYLPQLDAAEADSAKKIREFLELEGVLQ